MEDFEELLRKLADEKDVTILKITKDEFDENQEPAYDVVLSGDGSSIESLIENDIGNYESYSSDVDDDGNYIVTFAPIKGSWLEAIKDWCESFQYKPLKAGKLIDLDAISHLYSENDVMTIADDFTKKKLYYLHYSNTDSEYTITPACKALADSKFEGNSLQEFKSDLDAAGVDVENTIL